MKKSGKISLKIRIFISFFGILLLMLFTYIFTVNRFITRFTEQQLNEDYNSILDETCDTMQDLLWNLTLTSGQILDNEEIQNLLLLYQASTNPYIRQDYYSAILNEITLLTMANTDISLLYLYDNTESSFIYSSFPVTDINQDSILYQNSAFSFHGPCSSQSSYNGNPVLILNRTETLSNGSSVTLSIESGFYSILRPIESARRKSASLAVTNAEGELIYTSFSEENPDTSYIMTILEKGHAGNFRSMTREMSQGWKVYLIIPNTIYVQDYYRSLKDVIICTAVIALFIGLIAVYFWKSVYTPLQLFDRQLELVLSDNLEADQMHSSIPEYNHLLRKIVVLQAQIREMIGRIIEQEKLNTKIQLEKLRAQINPHFLMNTLNTIHWMALMNGQNDIDRITQSLSHLLSYNLDKESYITSLKGEISALSEYVTLQKVRYDFEFLIQCRQEVEHLNYPCPKFILQPLVENALSHGYREGMSISLSVFVDDYITIQISDTGTGMDNETLLMLRSLPETAVSDGTSDLPVSDSVHFGIGLQYVVQMLNDFYSGDYGWEIESSLCEGTSVTLKIPKLKGGGYCAENPDH